MINTNKNDIKIYEIITLTFIIILSCAFGALRIVLKNDVFAFLCGFSSLPLFFLFSGKYRIVSLMFFYNLTVLMNPHNFLGSLFSWICIIYVIITFIETIIKKNYTYNFLVLFLVFIILGCYILFVSLTNFFEADFVSMISYLSYMLTAIFFITDKKALKSPNLLIIFFSIGLLVSTLFSIYFIKFYSNPRAYIELVFPSQLKLFDLYPDRIRPCGLYVDPNQYSFYVLLMYACSICLFLKNKKLFTPLLINTITFLLSFMAESKTFFIGLIVLVLFIIVLFIIKSQHKAIVILVVCFSLFIIISLALSITPIFNIISRLLLIDFRTDGLDSLLSGRFKLWQLHITDFISNPFRFLFGYGFGAAKVPQGAHNLFLEILTHYGLFGMTLFSLYFLLFWRNFNCKKINGFDLIPITVVITYSISLHLLTDVAIFFVIFIIFSLCSMDKQLINKTSTINNSKSNIRLAGKDFDSFYV